MLIAISFGVLEFFLRRIPNEYKLKKEYLDKYSQNLEVLILGGSHGRSAFDPNYLSMTSFNAAQHSQSLDYDWEILKLYKNELTKLKFVILPISYGSLFMKIETSDEPWRAKNYILYFNIKISKNFRYNTEIMNGIIGTQYFRLFNYYLLGKSEINCSCLGWHASFEESPINYLKETGIAAAKRFSRNDTNCFYEMKCALDSIIDISQNIGCKIVLITTPVHNSFREAMNKEQMRKTFETIKREVAENDNCFYINMLYDESYSDVCFRDGDHLNAKGSHKLTSHLDSLLRKGGFLHIYE
jgi:hypothetical protein